MRELIFILLLAFACSSAFPDDSAPQVCSGDWLSIRITRRDHKVQTLGAIVDSEGKVLVPLYGELHVRGKTSDQVRKLLDEIYGRFYPPFEIRVTIGSGSMPVIASASGALTLVTSTEQRLSDPAYGCLVFEIKDKAGKPLHRENTGLETNKWCIGWIEDTQVSLFSWDTEVQCWNQQSDGSWKKE